jgi:hypothetical protein
VLEVGRGGKSDAEQLAYAVDQGRAILTHNIRDHLLLARSYQTPLRCLSRHTAEETRNRVIWLQDFR